MFLDYLVFCIELYLPHPKDDFFEVLTPPIPVNMTLFGKSDVMKGHTGLGWALNPMINVFIREREILTQRHTQREDGLWRRRQRLELCWYKPRNAKDCGQLPETRKRQKRILSQSLQREHVPALISTSSLWTWERISFCSFKTPNLLYFVTVALGSQCVLRVHFCLE